MSSFPAVTLTSLPIFIDWFFVGRFEQESAMVVVITFRIGVLAVSNGLFSAMTENDVQ